MTVEHEHFFVIKVLSQGGEWYTNALIENSFDAVRVGQFYRDQLGYSVQLWHKEKDVSYLLNGQPATMIIK